MSLLWVTSAHNTMPIDEVGELASRDHAPLTVHQSVPLLDPGRVSELAEDIRRNGVQHPLLVDGDLLRDGHHRYAAAREAGLDELPYTRRFV
jgi:ParB-like chromosome segregation protein Spo0J